MIEDIRALTAQLAADPTSLMFLRLGEALRQRGQFEAAAKVALAGLGRYPHLPDAHDLYARVLTDRQDYANAFDEWDTVLRLSPEHVGANKGIGFLYYRAGDRENALRHLRVALSIDPLDEGVRSAIERVSGGGEMWDQTAGTNTGPPVEPEPSGRKSGPTHAAAKAGPGGSSDPFFGLEGAHQRVLLVDREGFRIGGGLTNGEGADVSDVVAALLSSATREATRAAKLIGLGAWTHLTVECPSVSFCVVSPTPDTSLFAAMEAGMPVGQLHFLAERGSKAARAWLERVR